MTHLNSVSMSLLLGSMVADGYVDYDGEKEAILITEHGKDVFSKNKSALLQAGWSKEISDLG